MTRFLWTRFWHGFRVARYGAKCARCGGFEYSESHPRGMYGRWGWL